MPAFSLIAAAPPLVSAVLAAAGPLVPAEPNPGAPTAWTLAPGQQTAPTTDDGPQETAQPDAAAPDEIAPPAAPAAPPAAQSDTEVVNEIRVEGSYGPPASDPIEQINEESYRITQAVDQALVEPMAYAYRDGLPEPIRDGLGNVVRNLGEPSNALNFLLQGKVGKAFETLGRLAINTTVGVGGLFDVAGKKAKLPYRRNGLANTLGFYGVGPGPYLYLPVTGATTVRDLMGSTLDQALLPFAVGEPFNRIEFAATYFVINGLDQRLAFDEEIAAIAATDDPYLLRRETYLAKRRSDIAKLKGEPVAEEDAEWLEELEALKRAPAGAESPAPAEPPAPVEPPADPEALLITQPLPAPVPVPPAGDGR